MAGKSVLVPVWRLREIRNIADSMVYLAGRCPVGRLVVSAERKYLKPTAHIRLLIDPRLDAGEAYHYTQVLKGAEYGDPPHSKVDLIEVTIYFNSDTTTREKWSETARAIVRQLGWVIFFSSAVEQRVEVESKEEEEELIDYFVTQVIGRLPFASDNTNRPRLMLAHLQEIVKNDLHDKTEEVLPHIQRLLMPYLGPDGW